MILIQGTNCGGFPRVAAYDPDCLGDFACPHGGCSLTNRGRQSDLPGLSRPLGGRLKTAREISP